MAGSKTTRANTKRTVVRRRAVGTRDRIIAHLAAVAEITDPTGMASTRLAEIVGYPGSSVAFAQLLSGMERDGLIAREVRGKRTYRITLSGGAASAAAAGGADDVRSGRGGLADGGLDAHLDGGKPRPAGLGADSAVLDASAAPRSIDYDELARRLLIRLVRLVAAAPTDMDQVVAGLERELVTAWSRHGTLTAENVRLREELREAQRNLDLLRQRAPRLEITDELDQAEVVVLERLLAPGPGDEDQQPADGRQLTPG
jgi:hypothetical protein